MGMTARLCRRHRGRRDHRACRHGLVRATEPAEPCLVIANLLFASTRCFDYVLWAYHLDHHRPGWWLVDRKRRHDDLPSCAFFYNATEPVFHLGEPAMLSLAVRGFDLTPIIVWIAAVFLQRFVVYTFL